jgi:uncharacterized protein YbjT (DUF2867 family)
MFVTTGVTGQVGGVVATRLLEKGLPVRGVVRDPGKGAIWKERGAELAIADVTDAGAMTAAFAGAEAVFLLFPPSFDPAPGFPEVRAVALALKAALLTARPRKVVCLSTIGAQVSRPNLLSQLGLVEQELSTLPMPIAFLRPGWFMENSAWDLASAKEKGVIASFLQPLDSAFPMVSVADVGAAAARMLQEQWTGRRIVELEGPARVTPSEIAAAFGKALGRPVRAEIVPRDDWERLFRDQGMKNPEPRIRMIDGFNEGWIEFEGEQANRLKGATNIETAIAKILSA